MKGIIFVIDGMGDRPVKELGDKTPLENARTPAMDKMVEEGITGIMDTIRPGVRPGSDTAHLTLLGYDPYEVYTGRGPFEAAGVDLDVQPGDIAFRCNFATADEDLTITDRRAGRISSGTDKIADTINQMKIDDNVQIIFKESDAHRAVLVLRGKGLSDQITDADPKHEGNKPKTVKPLDDSEEAKYTADVVNQFVNKSYEMLKEHPVNLERIKEGKHPANIVLPRGVGAVPSVPSFEDKYNLKGACVAETGLIKGIGKIVGMDVINIPGATGGINTDIDSVHKHIIDTVKDDKYDFVLINVDGADEAGHDGDIFGKRDFIEKVDNIMKDLKEIDDIVLFVTADHSTPVSVMDHTGDPVPVFIKAPGLRVDDIKEYGERAAAKGGLCRIRGSDVMYIIRDLMNVTKKFGA
ncbi:MAG: 2,3-bisphosphoglycerate-independent phosphoglycerate mutase [Methanosphaera sp.]|uniref:2,3-bisphosphoglycerate-independent phosphoglycerate mutase n=1 Tax=Methanosphaera sp. TaxID=2666342 RepID=UPI002A4F5F7B|nr:2,3-bisphosphoglycerate-independent phosphoglycerate mutase [Methanobacteriaceae archaeon]MDY2744391.1 2,3-bisphosphoglycerate-independent phosphoglycerate mutase [Methanosphaera sp.]